MIIALPYLLLFSFYLYWYYINRKQYEKYIHVEDNKILFPPDRIVIFLYLFFYGLRGFIFTDCYQYYDLFTDLDNFTHENSYINFRFEPGYVLCNQIISFFTSNFFVFQFIWTLIDVILIALILKRESQQYFLFSFALLIPFFDGVQINMFRNIKGLLICYYAFKYIKQSKFAKYFLCVLIAASIHVSSLLFLPLYFIIKCNLRKFMLVLSFMSLVLYFTDLSFLNGIFMLVGLYTGGGKIDSVMNSYVNSDTSAGFTFGFIFRLLLMIVFFFKYEYLFKKNSIMINVAFLYVISSTAFNSILVLRDRFSALFALGTVCILPYVFDSIKSSQVRRLFMSICLIFLIGMVYIQHNTIVAKYENVLFGITPREKAEQRLELK